MRILAYPASCTILLILSLPYNTNTPQTQDYLDTSAPRHLDICVHNMRPFVRTNTSLCTHFSTIRDPGSRSVIVNLDAWDRGWMSCVHISFGDFVYISFWEKVYDQHKLVFVLTDGRILCTQMSRCRGADVEVHLFTNI